MRGLILSIGLIWLASLSSAFEVEDHAVFGDQDAGQVLRIISTADIAFFEPMILSYLESHPGVAVDYTVAGSSELMRALYDEGLSFDLAISSAMDLQTKLANDGQALRHSSDQTQDLPDWAVWNEMVFAFTQEPAAFVISNEAFADLPRPESRQQLITILRQNPEIFHGRVGTYDIRASGSGYLFATQDARTSDTYWRLTEVMGTLAPKLYCCTSDMIEDVASGKLAIAYNVLASYAEQSEHADAFTIILPSDFAIVMLRSMLIPKSSQDPELAAGFLDFVLGQTFPRGISPLLQSNSLEQANESALHRIRLGPGLLVYLDQFKNRSFLAEWENAILQE
ncbi:ABC transporter substrate-binding protein [Pacificoceanicola onchidii]|uniref:ABC transporter substrate-binding protein n=1 Tax=Pacificoceanicola onchidii TaxID=2562685 RepID=UPI0010A56737|nr:ABC transporter substrate-binding protein [Pacificoceanicola onchidii]